MTYRSSSFSVVYMWFHFHLMKLVCDWFKRTWWGAEQRPQWGFFFFFHFSFSVLIWRDWLLRDEDKWAQSQKYLLTPAQQLSPLRPSETLLLLARLSTWLTAPVTHSVQPASLVELRGFQCARALYETEVTQHGRMRAADWKWWAEPGASRLSGGAAAACRYVPGKLLNS